MALKSWLKDETNEKEIYDPFGHEFEDPLDIGKDFGLTRNSHFNHFPAGIYKTPLRFLLYYHPTKALSLIVKIINHVTDAYAKSERGKQSNIIAVKICNSDGSLTQQKGNAVLWGMYRGFVENTPYLLQSILMALEDWLLDLCRAKNGGIDRLIEYTYSYLLKTSTSVATTSVLSSVAMAYPERIGKLCLPILEVKEFYSWDISRLVGDQVPLAPFDNEIPFAQEERHKSNLLLHRKIRLENLVTKFQVGGYWDEINSILDDFASTAEHDDKIWKLALNRMDIRKYEIDKIDERPESNHIVVKPKIDQELIEIVDEAQDQYEITSKAAYIANWARNVYEGKEEIDITLGKWQNEYQDYRDLENSNGDFIKSFECPIYLAAIGIRHFHSALSEEELNWCIDTIENSLKKVIVENLRNMPSSIVFLEPAIKTVPFILSLELSDEKRNEIREIIFLSLLFLVTNEMEYPFESIRNTLWSIDNAFANACFAGMLEYAELHKQRKYYQHQSEEKKKYWENHLRNVDELSDRVCKGKIQLRVENLSFETHSHWYLGYAVLVIPLDTKSDILCFTI